MYSNKTPGSNDDSPVFCKASSDEASKIMEIIHQYEATTGQLVNLKKSSIFISRNTNQTVKDNMCHILGDVKCVTQGKYLGLPMVITKSKNQNFGVVRERIKKRIMDWKCNFLSLAGRETLIKPVALAMPVYVMSCFKLFKSLCTEIKTMLARFWWKARDGEFKVHWKKWKDTATNKDKGGMGFRDIQLFNETLLTKQLWRILIHPNFLVSKMLKTKYFAKAFLFDAPIPRGSSWFWKSVSSVKYLLEAGLSTRVGDGRTIHIWKDK
ncbi:hypothetical protein ACH5RR_003831 [Cinchona calisaya]|uniref:Reverse transcriptase n=1 Tax=Cinchona calisaya TaxID=153742 RepID=A0ABD3AW61_9GENT